MIFRISSMLPQAMPLQTMTNKEDKEFLSMQHENVSSCSIAGIGDKKSRVESRRGKRKEQDAALKLKCNEREAKIQGDASAYSSAPQRRRNIRLRTITDFQLQPVHLILPGRGPRKSSDLLKLSTPLIESVSQIVAVFALARLHRNWSTIFLT